MLGSLKVRLPSLWKLRTTLLSTQGPINVMSRYWTGKLDFLSVKEDETD